MKRRYLPEILRNFDYLDTFPMELSSLPELMILLEEAIDIQERHWRLHWMLNLAQFQSSITFESILIPLVGEEHKPLVGRILVSDEDRNWDSVRALWTLKNKVKASSTLKRSFDENDTADGVMRALHASDEGNELLKDIDAYRNEYGNKSLYAHEYLYVTWRENPRRSWRRFALSARITTTRRTSASCARTAMPPYTKCGRSCRQVRLTRARTN